MKPRAVSPPREIFRNPFIHLYAVRATFDGFEKEYFVTDRGNRVGVLILRGDEVLLVRQYRFIIDGESWEIPGGGIGPSETPHEAAIRECREEAGIVVRAVEPLFEYGIGIDVTAGRVSIFRCVDWEETADRGDGKETDDRTWRPVDECLKRVMAGEIKDTMTAMALMIHRYRPGA